MPFFLAGMALSMIFDLQPAIAAARCTSPICSAPRSARSIVTLLLQGLGGETTVLVAALAPFGAAACLSRAARAIRGLAAAAAVLVAVVAITNETYGPASASRPGTLKAMRRQMDELPGTRVTQTGWNAYSRIDAVEGFPAPNLARLYIDSDAWTSILDWDGNLDERARHEELVPRAAVQVRAERRTRSSSARAAAPTCSVALASGSRKVTRGRAQPADAAVRAPLRRARRQSLRPARTSRSSRARAATSSAGPTGKFDIIFLGFVDSWASVASGGLSLSENYLYTTQALQGYYDHLTDDGMLVHPAMGRGHPAAGVELGRAARRRGSGQAHRRARREARRRPRRSAADDLHAAQAPVHRGGDRRRS